MLAASPANARASGRPADCATWQACRDLSLASAEAGEYERAHDLAWRAVQLGPPRSPELMYLLARAQSLSGRPGDALVLLARLADMGVATDADVSPDFHRVRNLPGWPDVEIAARGGSHPVLSTPPSPAGTSGSGAPGPASRAAAAIPSSPAALPAVRVDQALRLSGSPVPGSLAYDGVSNRFLIGGRSERKIVVVNESSGRVDDLVRADSAGFRDIVALAIDRARGDLWVISDERAGGDALGHGNGHASARGGTARLHKLQLVAGRPLATYEPPAAQPPPRFTELTVTMAGTVLVLDGPASRIFRTGARGGALDLAFAGDLDIPVGIAAAGGERFVYVARRGGLSRVDLVQRTALPVAANGIDLVGLERIWWHGGTLVAVQTTGAGTRRIVRVGLDQGGLGARSLQVIDDGLPAAEAPVVGTLWGDDLFYVVHEAVVDSDRAASTPASRNAAQTVVRRARLR
jgi:hypothetical protein